MLNFYHDLGIIVKHSNTVVLRAQWLIDVFKELITIPSLKKRKREHFKLWRERETRGALHVELVDHVFSKCCQQSLIKWIKEDILNMMEQFGLIVKIITLTSPTNETKTYFVVPCQLKAPETNLEMAPLRSNPCPLYLHFSGGFVPYGFFWQLVSRCSRWCSESKFKHAQPPKVFLAASEFIIEKEDTHHLILLCKKRFIKVILTHSQPEHETSLAEKREVAILVRTFLEETVKNLRHEHSWLSNFNCDFCVVCPDCLQKEEACCIHDVVFCDHEDCLCFLEILEEGKPKHCQKALGVKERTVEGLEKWFADKVVRPRYHPGTDFVYNMTAARPRGITLIINNASFAHHPDHGKQSTRHGSEEDVSRVKTLFAALDFSVQTEQDLSKQQLLHELSNVTQEQDHSGYDCFVLWLMSHGRSGEVFCSDGDTLSLETLDNMFSECKTLRSKPKLFFIQACRGIGEDEGQLEGGRDSPDNDIPSLNQANRSYESMKVDSVIQSGRIPSYSDFLYAFSTVDEYVSYRNKNEGSHYVRCFVEAFREHVAHDHILDILTVVNHKVSKIDTKRPSSKNRNETKICKQMPQVKHTLRKKLRF